MLGTICLFVSLLAVKPINHIEQNRPVHLALRDTYYEQATALMRDPKHMTVRQLDASDYEEILFMLRTAREHGHFAVRNDQKNEKDGQFNGFINMLAGNVKAVLSMLNLKYSVEAEDGFFFAFLDVNHASVALQAEEYERRARDIIRCMHNTLNLANHAFEELKQANNDSFGDAERERYDKAVMHHKQLLGQRSDLPKYKRRAELLV